MSYIFISYSKKNKQYAYALAEFLQKAGFDIWIDRADIEYGVDWWDAIVEGVRGCGAFVPIMTPESKTSPWVKREVFLALDWQKALFPLLLNGANWELFVLTQYVDVTSHKGMPDDEFLERLSEYVTPKNVGGQDFYELASPTPQPVLEFDLAGITAEFGRAFKRKDWAVAMELLGRMRASGEDTSPFDPDAFEQRVQRAIEAENRQREQERYEAERAKKYQVLVDMADYADEKILRQALRKFWQTFPDYDPQGLAGSIPLTKVQSTSTRSKVLDILPQPFEWITIPAGKVTLATDPPQTYDVSAFQIAKYPITNAQYQVFVDAKDGYVNKKWWDFLKQASEWRKQNTQSPNMGFVGNDLPRSHVTWHGCIAFCRWLSAKTGDNITLPTEQQWQRAAQGDDGREYPWGNGFDKRGANTKESGIGQVTPVTRYPNGVSPYGVLDMAGNVWEWCLSDYEKPTSSNINCYAKRSLHGGSYFDDASWARAAFRLGELPHVRDFELGFRIALLL